MQESEMCVSSMGSWAALKTCALIALNRNVSTWSFLTTFKSDNIENRQVRVQSWHSHQHRHNPIHVSLMMNAFIHHFVSAECISTGNCTFLSQEEGDLNYQQIANVFFLPNHYCRDLFGANTGYISHHPPRHQLNYLSGHALRLLFISLGSC